ncbi:hypothetical protein LINPERHAP2_LOCUS17897 [Linum perenne]
MLWFHVFLKSNITQRGCSCRHKRVLTRPLFEKAFGRPNVWWRKECGGVSEMGKPWVYIWSEPWLRGVET